MRKASYSEELFKIVRAMNSKEIDAPTAIRYGWSSAIAWESQPCTKRVTPG